MKSFTLGMTIFIAMAAAACATDVVSKTLYIGPQKVDCVGIAPQKCLPVKEKTDGEWTYLYQQIEGFAYEEGYDYTLEVTEYPVVGPPADAPGRNYKLNKVLSKTRAAASNLAGTRWRLSAMGPGCDGL